MWFVGGKFDCNLFSTGKQLFKDKKLTSKTIKINFTDQFQNRTEGCRNEHIVDITNNQEGEGKVCHCYEDLCNKEVPDINEGSQFAFNGVAVIIVALFVNLFNQY